MKYTVRTYGGESILLSDDQYFRVVQAWDSGAEEFNINDQRIPRKAISYIGYTEGALDEIKNEENAYMMSLTDEERRAIREAQYQKAREQVASGKSKIIDAGKERVWKRLGNTSLTLDNPQAK
jgi:hypothetical protein